MPVWIRALLFTALVPGAVAGWIPWRIGGVTTHATAEPSLAHLLGALLLLLGWSGLIWGVVDFARHGRGTPGPYDPPRVLVDTGLYRAVRNPMYCCVLLAIAGCALWTGSGAVGRYLLGAAVCFHVMVIGYEEPHLLRLFGERYVAYRARVPRWVPRMRQWRGLAEQ
jgi:protein-S-isoprenylcysteine O-methyltransferase Ste14